MRYLPVNALSVYQNAPRSQEFSLDEIQCLQAAHNPTCSPARGGNGRSQARAGLTSPCLTPADLLRDGNVEMLERYNWNLFGSMTFRTAKTPEVITAACRGGKGTPRPVERDIHPEHADKIFRHYIAKLNRELYGPRWLKHGKGIAYARAIEMQSRGVIHFHCLLSSPLLNEVHRAGWYRQPNGRWANGMNELWNRMAGFARIEPVGLQDAVNRYISKYVVKGGEIDYGGPLGAPWTLKGYEGASASL